MSDHFAEFDENSTSVSYLEEEKEKTEKNKYSKEIFSEKISAKYRTFFIDVKKNKNGHLIKISEKSRGGKKSTIMFDKEDLIDIISALQNANDHCSE